MGSWGKERKREGRGNELKTQKGRCGNKHEDQSGKGYLYRVLYSNGLGCHYCVDQESKAGMEWKKFIVS